MARRRGRSAGGEAGDSLDLLLDTICNTFGGVLFMAMLICLLAGKPSARAHVDAESSARDQLASMDAEDRRRRAEADAETRARRATRDRAAVDAQLAELATRIGSDASTVTNMAAHFADRDAEVRDALSSRDQLGELARRAQEKREAIAVALAGTTQRRAEAKAADGAAVAAQDRSRLSLRVPTAHATNKQQAVAFVSRGRLYAGVYPSADYRGHVPAYRGNTAGGNSIGPQDLPDALGSAPIASSGDAARALTEQRLAALDPTAAYVVFAVWPDSHEAFRLLRDALTARGIGYGLLLMGEAEPVGFGGKGDKYEQ